MIIELAEYGVAYHHAGLCYQDRLKVEEKFSRNEITVICKTIYYST